VHESLLSIFGKRNHLFFKIEYFYQFDVLSEIPYPLIVYTN